MDELKGLRDVVAEVGLEGEDALQGGGAPNQLQWVDELSQFGGFEGDLGVVFFRQ